MNRNHALRIVGLIGLGILTGNIQGQIPKTQYIVTDLGTLGGDSGTIARSINNSGQIVGGSCLGESIVHVYIYSNGSMKDLGTLGGTYGQGIEVNDLGQVVGTANVAGDAYSHAFLYSNGTMKDIGSSIEPYGINIHGQIACTAYFVGYNHAASYQNGVKKDIGTLGGISSGAWSINDSGQIVGISETKEPKTAHAFLYSNGTMKDLGTLGGTYSAAYKINNKGDIVGNSTLKGDTVAHAFLYSNNHMTDLGSLSKYSSVAYGINMLGQVVGQALTDPISEGAHGFLFSNGIMSDLNSLVIPGSDWTIEVAISINDKGQIVGYGRHGLNSQRAFLLTPFSLETIEKKPEPPKYGELPVKEFGKDSLVVVTHGRIRNGDDPDVSTAWVNSMSGSITSYLTAHNINNWQVCGYKWVEGAQASIFSVLGNARQQGISLGLQIITKGYAHIHFIAHSAGSGLIQAATDVIKNHNSSVIIHETFLDPYVGLEFIGTSTYGNNANWADNYSSKDYDTYNEFVPFTYNMLTHAYNVDVTLLDMDNRKQLPYWVTGNDTPCYTTESTHDWPINFYMNSIRDLANSDYDGFGFPLSEVGGNWDYALNHYAPRNSPPGHILGIPDPTGCRFEFPAPSYQSFVTDFLNYSAEQSTTGTIEKYPNGSIKMKSGSPVWLATFVAVSNTVNIVSFDANFMSTNGARGLLSVYWNENSIGSIDEYASQKGSQHYTFKFPNSSSNSLHMLGFRLDPFNTIQSAVVITNVTTTLNGTSQLPSLTTTRSVNGLQTYQLTGQSGFEYHIQASTNLVDWIPIAVLANTNGTVLFTDHNSTNYIRRFYRAVAPY